MGLAFVGIKAGAAPSPDCPSRSEGCPCIRGREVDLETPAEIIAKKVYYRGDRMQPRDMFDIAAVA